jgi:hypothetical protein
MFFMAVAVWVFDSISDANVQKRVCALKKTLGAAWKEALRAD